MEKEPLHFGQIGSLLIRRQAVQEQAEAAIALCNEHGFPYWLAEGTMLRGWALAEQGQGTEGIRELRRGLAVY